ncbi:MAG: phosphoribosylanthranilate isomerase [Pseudomonadota bacterium]
MTVEVKICGLSTAETVTAACDGGTRWVGFNFFPKSPRYVSAAHAGDLAPLVPPHVGKVAVLVDPDDRLIGEILDRADMDLLQLHGAETPARAAEIRKTFGLPVMKVLSVAGSEDLQSVASYLPVVDRLMFDAKAPAPGPHSLPGGNAITFDWTLLAGRNWPLSWMLAGGLTTANMAEAVRISGAETIDVSSGVEESRGVKSVQMIADFLAKARTL